MAWIDDLKPVQFTGPVGNAPAGSQERRVSTGTLLPRGSDTCPAISARFAPVVSAGSGGYSGIVSVIVSEVYDALLEAGASEAKAKAAAGAIPVGEQLVTKADLMPLATDIARLEADVRVIKAVYGPIVIGPLLSIAGMVFMLVFLP